MTTLILIAKAPVAGRVKTRLCPPCTPAEAAALAAAAIHDTATAMESAARCGDRLVLALDRPCAANGRPRLATRFADWEVHPQRGGGLDARIAAAFSDSGSGPALLVGMDTPQITPEMLRVAATALTTHRSVIGPAADGGFWLVGARRPDPALFVGVPMSRSDTGAHQRRRLVAAGLQPCELDELVDVDTIADANAVARAAPHTRFAATLRGLHLESGVDA